MTRRDIVVIGASTGGVEALTRLVGGLPADLDASLFVVLHRPTDARTRLPEILGRSSKLPVVQAVDGDPIVPGRIVIAAPDHHLELSREGVHLAQGPRENGFRPAIDPLFVSAARAFGGRVIGVLLSGALGDGVAGLMAIRHAGGVAVVQDPADAQAPELPSRARDVAGADHVVSASAIGRLLTDLGAEPVLEPPTPPRATTPYTCPSCGGAIWEVGSRPHSRFECHLGHAFLGLQLYTSQAAALENALWVSVRTFRERATLARELAVRERERGRPDDADRLDDQATVADRHAKVLIELLPSAASTTPSA